MKNLREKLIWIMIKFKLFCLVMALGISGLNAKVWSQQEKLSLTMNGDLVQLF